jgi:hypothetical protein
LHLCTRLRGAPALARAQTEQPKRKPDPGDAAEGTYFGSTSAGVRELGGYQKVKRPAM